MTTHTSAPGATTSATTDMTDAPFSRGLLPAPLPVRFLNDAGERVQTIVDDYAEPAPEQLVEAYRRMVIGRRFDVQATALTKQGRLAVYPSSHGQEACQVAAVLALRRRRLAVPDLPRHRRARHPRHRPGRGADAAARRLALRLRPVRPRVAPAVHAAGHPAAARRRRRARAPGCKGEARSSHGLRRRRRHQRGRLPRGAQLRRGVQGAGRVLRPEQRVRDLACRSRGRPRRRRWPTRAIGYGVPAEQVDGNDLVAVLAVLERGRRRRPAPARGRCSSRRTPTGCEAHTNADDATRYRDEAEVAALASPATRSPGWRPTCAAGPAHRRGRRAGAPPRPRRSPPTARRA